MTASWPRQEQQVDGLAASMVRVALLVRQLALAAAVLAELFARPSPTALVVVFALLLTSQLGLHSVRVLRLVERHPSLALVDVLLVTGATAALGPRHPVVLVALTSALVIGVLFSRAVSPLLVLLLLAGHVASLRDGAGLTTFDVIGMPVVIVSIAAVGLSYRLLAEKAQQTEREAARARQDVATAEERLRLARDVHDTVAKSVQGVALLASSLPQWIARDPDRAVRHADLVASSARDAVDEARSLLSGLRHGPDDGSFGPWLAERLAAWSAGRTAAVRLELEEVPELDPAVCREVRAALDEVLENIDRHAPEAAVLARLVADDQGVVLVVRDDGPGFDRARREEAVSQAHYGVVGIAERLAAVGGRGEVTSTPGSGTEVVLVAPLPHRVLDLSRLETRAEVRPPRSAVVAPAVTRPALRTST